MQSTISLPLPACQSNWKSCFNALSWLLQLPSSSGNCYQIQIWLTLLKTRRITLIIGGAVSGRLRSLGDAIAMTFFLSLKSFGTSGASMPSIPLTWNTLPSSSKYDEFLACKKNEYYHKYHDKYEEDHKWLLLVVLFIITLWSMVKAATLLSNLIGWKRSNAT